MPCCWQATSSSDLKRKNGRSGDDTPDNKPNERKSQKNKSKTNKSSNSQQKTTTHTFSKDSVVSRLKQASLRAAARVKAEEELAQRIKNQQQSQKQRADPQFTRDLSDNDDDNQHSMNHNKPKMASLRDLTAEIDAQLQVARQAGSALYNNNNHNGAGAARDSMTAVMQHNEEQQQQAAQDEEPSAAVLPTALFAPPSRRQPLTTVHKHVAVVLSKPLQDDQVTVEYASRLQRLVRLLQPQCGSDDNDKQPDCYYELVVFVGDRHGTAVLADCDAGYTYFRHLCAAQQINLTGTSTTPTAAAADDGDTGEEQLTGDDSGEGGGGGGVQFHLERSSVQEGALQKVAQHVQQHRLPAWLLDAQQQALQQPESKETPAVASARRRHRVKLHIHFALVSSEYHLCILHDIHARSPVNSPLAALERWSLPSSWSDNNKNVDVQLETSWTYEYAATVRIRSAQDPVKALAAACYQRAQSLIPVSVWRACVYMLGRI